MKYELPTRDTTITPRHIHEAPPEKNLPPPSTPPPTHHHRSSSSNHACPSGQRRPWSRCVSLLSGEGEPNGDTIGHSVLTQSLSYLPCGHVCWHGTDHWCRGHATGANQWEDAFTELWDTQLEVDERIVAVARRERAAREREEAVAERERMVAERERAIAEAERQRAETARARLLGGFARPRWP